MKKILLGVVATIITASAFAGEAKVTWQSPEKFTDIRAGNESRDGFQARVMKDFDQFFADLAKKLPDNYQWDITVTDLDLAGDVRGLRRRPGQDIRIIKEIDWPRMSFSYTLKNPANQVVVSGKEELKDMNFMSTSGMRTGNSSFYYEEKMLHDWFNKQQRAKIFPNR